MVGNFLLAITIFISGSPICEAAEVQFFEQNDFQGYRHDEISSKSCKNLPYDYRNLEGSIKTTECIMVYPELNCRSSGFIIRSQQSILWTPQQDVYGDNLLKYEVSSFKDCTPLQNSDKVEIDIYKYENRRGGIVAKFRDMCECHNLPRFLEGKDISANLHGNCVKVYVNEDCKGKQWIKYGEHDTTKFRVETDELFYDILSLQPCTLSTHCNNINLTATVIEVKAESYSPKIPTELQKSTQLGKQTFTNDGNAEHEELFEVKKEIMEVSRTELSESLSVMTSISTSLSSESESEVSIPEVGKVTQKITATLNSGLQTQRGSEKKKSKAVHNRREIRFQKKVTVPPCSKLEVTSILKMAEGVEINYKMQMRVNGTMGSGTRMTAVDIRKYLKDLTFLRNEDQFTVIAEGNAKLITSYQLETNTESVGEPLPDCKSKYNL